MALWRKAALLTTKAVIQEMPGEEEEGRHNYASAHNSTDTLAHTKTSSPSTTPSTRLLGCVEMSLGQQAKEKTEQNELLNDLMTQLRVIGGLGGQTDGDEAAQPTRDDAVAGGVLQTTVMTYVSMQCNQPCNIERMRREETVKQDQQQLHGVMFVRGMCF